MSDTTAPGRSLSTEEIDRLKIQEAERYERLQRMGTVPEEAPQAKPRMNRKLRRKMAALSQ